MNDTPVYVPVWKMRRVTRKARNPARLKVAALKHLYGVTPEAVAELLKIQVGVCAICQRPPVHSPLVIDHDHKTGRVRGLLCRACNLGLGAFSDTPEWLVKAAKYLCDSR